MYFQFFHLFILESYLIPCILDSKIKLNYFLTNNTVEEIRVTLASTKQMCNYLLEKQIFDTYLYTQITYTYQKNNS